MFSLSRSLDGQVQPALQEQPVSGGVNWQWLRSDVLTEIATLLGSREGTEDTREKAPGLLRVLTASLGLSGEDSARQCRRHGLGMTEPGATATEPVLGSPGAATREATAASSPHTTAKSGPLTAAGAEPAQQRQPSTGSARREQGRETARVGSVGFRHPGPVNAT